MTSYSTNHSFLGAKGVEKSGGVRCDGISDETSEEKIGGTRDASDETRDVARDETRDETFDSKLDT